MNARLLTLRTSALCAVLFASASSARAQSKAEPELPRYAQVMEQELVALGTNAHCERETSGRYHCAWSRAATRPGGELSMHAVYSAASDTVYFYIERYLSLPPEGAKTTATLRRLMEINWELLVGKFEWNPRTGEVRVSAVLDTDSNFDRRAFRSIVRALETVATRYDRELRE